MWSLRSSWSDGEVGGGNTEAEAIGMVFDVLDKAMTIHVSVSALCNSVSGAEFLFLRVAVGVFVAVLTQGVLSLVLAGAGHHGGRNHSRCGGGYCKGSSTRYSNSWYRGGYCNWGGTSYSDSGSRGGYNNRVSVGRDSGVTEAPDWLDNCDRSRGGNGNGSGTGYSDSWGGSGNNNRITSGSSSKAVDAINQ